MSDDRIQAVIDRDEIRQLAYRYGHTWDNLDFEGWAGVFAEDGVYWEGGGPVFKGRKELLGYVQDTAPRVNGRFHMVLNQYIEVDGDTGRGHSYFMVVEGLTPIRSGTYDDRLVRTDEGWRFAKRTVSCLYPAGLPIEGPDMAAWVFSEAVGGGFQHRSKWRALQYGLPSGHALFRGAEGS